MVKATLFIDGARFRIYLLTVDGRSEVKDFFDWGIADSGMRGIVSGFVVMLNHMGSAGMADLTDKQLKCWRHSGEMMCELRKGRHRISAFHYQGRIVLLATHFQKTKDVETAEYDRALRLKRRFDAEGTWED